MLKNNKHPEIIHCHDWQTGLLPAYLKTVYAGDPTFQNIASLMTIHNLRFYQKLMQGLRDSIAAGRLESFTADFLEKLSLGP